MFFLSFVTKDNVPLALFASISLLTLADFLFTPCWPQLQLLVNNLLTEPIHLFYNTPGLACVSIMLNNLTCQRPSPQRTKGVASRSVSWTPCACRFHRSLSFHCQIMILETIWGDAGVGGRWWEETREAFTHWGYPVRLFLYGTWWEGWFPWVHSTLGSCVFVEVGGGLCTCALQERAYKFQGGYTSCQHF